MFDIRRDKSEILHYDNPDFRVFARKNYIPAHCEFTNTSLHWHDELEFIYVLSGKIRYMVDGRIILINEGEGIFVNARHLHVIMNETCDSLSLCIIFSPALLCSDAYITKKYVEPVLAAEGLDCILLRQDDSWQSEILKRLDSIYNNSIVGDRELNIMLDIYELWNALCNNTEVVNRGRLRTKESLTTFKKLIEYIQNNYADKITLDDLCDHAGINKNKCTSIFKKYANMLPIDYVRYYRIEKSMELLRDTDMNITEIAYKVGFSGSSYYTETFRKSFGISPTKARRDMHKDNTSKK